MEGVPIPKNVFSSGVTFPAPPYEGQLFTHTPTGRSILYEYIDSAWVGLHGLGAMDLYVDSAGTDDLDHGTAAGADAFLTLEFALAVIPPNYSDDVTINVSSGSYAGATVTGKQGKDGATITILGTYAEQRSLTTVSSATPGSNVLNGTITVNGSSMALNQYRGMILKFADDTDTVDLQGLSFLILGNSAVTNSVIEIIGAWSTGFGVTPSSSDTFTIERSATIIASTFSVNDNQKNIVLERIRAQSLITPNNGAGIDLIDSEVEVSSSYCLSINQGSLINLTRTHLHGTTASQLVLLNNNCTIINKNSLINGLNAGTAALILSRGSHVEVSWPSVFLGVGGATYGIYLEGGSTFRSFISPSNYTKNQMDNFGTGIHARTGSHGIYASTTYWIYSACSVDYSADAATFATLA